MDNNSNNNNDGNNGFGSYLDIFKDDDDIMMTPPSDLFNFTSHSGTLRVRTIENEVEDWTTVIGRNQLPVQTMSCIIDKGYLSHREIVVGKSSTSDENLARLLAHSWEICPVLGNLFDDPKLLDSLVQLIIPSRNRTGYVKKDRPLITRAALYTLVMNLLDNHTKETISDTTVVPDVALAVTDILQYILAETRLVMEDFYPMVTLKLRETLIPSFDELTKELRKEQIEEILTQFKVRGKFSIYKDFTGNIFYQVLRPIFSNLANQFRGLAYKSHVLADAMRILKIYRNPFTVNTLPTHLRHNSVLEKWSKNFTLVNYVKDLNLDSQIITEGYNLQDYVLKEIDTLLNRSRRFKIVSLSSIKNAIITRVLVDKNQTRYGVLIGKNLTPTNFCQVSQFHNITPNEDDNPLIKHTSLARIEALLDSAIKPSVESLSTEQIFGHVAALFSNISPLVVNSRLQNEEESNPFGLIFELDEIELHHIAATLAQDVQFIFPEGQEDVAIMLPEKFIYKVDLEGKIYNKSNTVYNFLETTDPMEVILLSDDITPSDSFKSESYGVRTRDSFINKTTLNSDMFIDIHEEKFYHANILGTKLKLRTSLGHLLNLPDTFDIRITHSHINFRLFNGMLESIKYVLDLTESLLNKYDPEDKDVPEINAVSPEALKIVASRLLASLFEAPINTMPVRSMASSIILKLSRSNIDAGNKDIRRYFTELVEGEAAYRVLFWISILILTKSGIVDISNRRWVYKLLEDTNQFKIAAVTLPGLNKIFHI